MVKKQTANSTDTVPGGLSREAVERLLCGAVPEGESLGSLPSVVEALRRVGEPAPTEIEVQRFAAEAAGLVPAKPVRRPTAHRRSRLSLRLAGAAAALVVMLSAFGGLAYAANGAVPGDTLYGLDLALEKVRVGDGGLEERLTEASRLVERGRAQEGLNLAGDSIAGSAAGDQDLLASAEALHAAADSAAGNQGLQSPEDRALVASRLRSIASAELNAKDLGLAVQELTSDLGPGGQGGGGGEGQGTVDPGQGTGGSPVPTDPNGGGAGVGPGSGDGSGTGSGAGGNR